MNSTRPFIIFTIIFPLFLIQPLVVSPVDALTSTVVNVDFEGSPPGTTYVDDNGILSTTGGMTWNSVDCTADGIDLLDENGASTDVDILLDSPNCANFSTCSNELQNSGIADSGFYIGDLLQGQLYDVAVYVSAATGFFIEDASGVTGGFCSSGTPSCDLDNPKGGLGTTLGSPGDIVDYCSFTGLEPFDIGGGVFGLAVGTSGGLDGGIVGIQIAGDFGGGGGTTAADMCATATPTGGCRVNNVNNQLCVGTAGDDTIIGTPGDDVIFGGAGDDILRGNVGDDILCGEADDDVLIGATGKDVLFGDTGEDDLRGNGEEDTLDGGDDADVLNGGSGTDACTSDVLDTLILNCP